MVRSSKRLQAKTVSKGMEKDILSDKLQGYQTKLRTQHASDLIPKRVEGLRSEIVIKQEVGEPDEIDTNSQEKVCMEYVEVVKSQIKTEEDIDPCIDNVLETTFHGSIKTSVSENCSIEDDSSAEDDDPDDPECTSMNSEEDESNDDTDDDNWSISRKKKTSDPSLFSCFHCDFTCKLKSELTSHLKKHGGTNTVKCEFCDDTFLKSQSLKVHLHTKHPSLVNDKSLAHKCKFCKRKYSTKYYLLNHIRAIHKKDTPYECTLCNKKFAWRGGLVQHEQYHQKARPFSCKLCNASFKTKANRETHMRRHFGVKAFKCDECDKDFVRKDQLKKHVASVHREESTYKCSICNKYLKGHVVAHLRTHSSEKLFSCTMCEKSFAQSSQLTVHMRIHTGSKPYQCEICQSSFAYSPALKAHMLIHTGEKPFKCPLCSAAFKQLPHMKKHMRCIHKCDKPYVCVPCHKFFKTKVELENHTNEDKKCKRK